VVRVPSDATLRSLPGSCKKGGPKEPVECSRTYRLRSGPKVRSMIVVMPVYAPGLFAAPHRSAHDTGGRSPVVASAADCPPAAGDAQCCTEHERDDAPDDRDLGHGTTISRMMPRTITVSSAAFGRVEGSPDAGTPQ
jgi:hypothetical protein